MRSAFTLVSSLHRSINGMVTSTNHIWRYLDHTLNSNELGPHPDDIDELDAMMESDANVLRELAHEIEMRRIELKRNALQYQLAAE